MSTPYRINTLVEMCSGNMAQDKLDDGVGAAMRKASGWLEANPGRWFVVGEIISSPSVLTIGMDVSSGKRAGFEVETVNNKIYARVPHVSGLPLSDFVTRIPPKRASPLPTLQTDPFEWSIAELRKAAETAREWLMPGMSYAAA